MVIEKTSRKDNITPKTFSKLAYEKDVNEQFPKGIFFSLLLHFVRECKIKMSDE